MTDNASPTTAAPPGRRSRSGSWWTNSHALHLQDLAQHQGYSTPSVLARSLGVRQTTVQNWWRPQALRQPDGTPVGPRNGPRADQIGPVAELLHTTEEDLRSAGQHATEAGGRERVDAGPTVHGDVHGGVQ